MNNNNKILKKINVILSDVQIKDCENEIAEIVLEAKDKIKETIEYMYEYNIDFYKEEGITLEKLYLLESEYSITDTVNEILRKRINSTNAWRMVYTCKFSNNPQFKQAWQEIGDVNELTKYQSADNSLDSLMLTIMTIVIVKLISIII